MFMNAMDISQKEYGITVVLTTYKKPEALKEQLEAIEKQTVKAKEIFLYQDGIDDYYSISFNQEFLDKFDNVKICEKNTGVWGRFNFARTAKTEYVCIFDDDTIPGDRWLENCMINMVKQEGIYGTVGIVIEDCKGYPFNGYYKVGWCAPYSKCAQVDFVGHSWFVKRNYLDYMFEGTEKYQQFKRAAEDMALSFKCQQHGIATFVPPHPYDDLSLWGSQPKTGKKYGTLSTAISQSNAGNNDMGKAISMYVEDGWHFLSDRDKEQFLKTGQEIENERKRNEAKTKFERKRNKIKTKLSKVIKK